jgi:Adenylate and Guanylate cyclase catalytic domain
VTFASCSFCSYSARSSVLLQIGLLLAILGGLSVLRRDVEVLVLGPLRRMLKIVDRYARNPLLQTKISRRSSHRRLNSAQDSDDDTVLTGGSGDDNHNTSEELGSFETEQLITAVAKITDLLRKCWGVAGADIISTNLSTQEGALTEVFNPTVPGKSVYALFGFAAIGGFDNALRNLGGEVMPLINDVAAVLHGEVFRWGFGDSGQCNKNLGSAFLMVFRIGLVQEVIEKLEQATDVVFSTSAGKKSQVSGAVRRRQYQRNSVLRSSSGTNFSSPVAAGTQARGSLVARSSVSTQRKKSETSDAMSLSLQSLPGISTFTDRAVIGMLKSYAGIYRDKNILKWNNDFRLGAGVGAFKISMIFGMDAGWAVEGAVGSEYKIDATYLSPHVNMASRMMSACKQYDVTIMLSQSVQELMSDVAQSKLRHLDTVTVKGSSVKQKIYTYDARARGVDFFLHSRSDNQADAEADRYSPAIWMSDPDLLAMRQHITDDFLKVFKEGHKAFLSGDWPTAIEKMELANDIMFQTAVDEGYLEDEFDALNLRAGEDIRRAAEELKRENGDGPCMYLLNFMKSQGGVAPPQWDGWHPLIRK